MSRRRVEDRPPTEETPEVKKYETGRNVSGAYGGTTGYVSSNGGSGGVCGEESFPGSSVPVCTDQRKQFPLFSLRVVLLYTGTKKESNDYPTRI